MPRGFTEEEMLRIQGEMIRSGREIFGRFGYDKTSLDRIVESVGIAKGSFYKFYPNKELFYLACLADLEGEMEKNLITPLIENARSGEELLGGLADLALGGYADYPLLRSWFETPSRERILSFVDREQRELMDRADRERMERVKERLVALGSPFPGTGEDLAALFRALFLLNGNKSLISHDFQGFVAMMKGIITKGALS